MIDKNKAGEIFDKIARRPAIYRLDEEEFCMALEEYNKSLPLEAEVNAACENKCKDCINTGKCKIESMFYSEFGFFTSCNQFE